MRQRAAAGLKIAVNLPVKFRGRPPVFRQKFNVISSFPGGFKTHFYRQQRRFHFQAPPCAWRGKFKNGFLTAKPGEFKYCFAIQDAKNPSKQTFHANSHQNLLTLPAIWRNFFPSSRQKLIKKQFFHGVSSNFESIFHPEKRSEQPPKTRPKPGITSKESNLPNCFNVGCQILAKKSVLSSVNLSSQFFHLCKNWWV